MIIEDGLGTGRTAAITPENRLLASAVIATTEHNANHKKGEAYNAVFAVNPDGADDCIFYLQNTSDTDLIIEGFWLSMSAADEIYFKLGETGTAVKTNGSDITPSNLNAGSGHTADCTCYSNTADGAVDITGLSGGSTFQKIWIVAAGDTKHFNFEQDIILPKNQVFTIYSVGGDVLIRGTLVFNFHSTMAR